MSIVLVGYRGSGKTTVGRRLADRLWQTFIDTDAEIVRESGRSIRELFASVGEPGFRDLESSVLRRVLSLPEHVISLGGGAVIREQNRQLIAGTKLKVIYLRCEPEELLRRIDADPLSAQTRPDLLSGGIAEIHALLQQREPLYRQVMTAELDVTRLSAEDAVLRITRMV